MDSSGLVLGLRVLLALAVVLGLLWWLARKTSGGTRIKAATVRVVGRQSLGRHAGVTVVEVEGRRLLLGVTDQGVSLLTELTAVQDVEPDARTEIDPADLARLVDLDEGLADDVTDDEPATSVLALATSSRASSTRPAARAIHPSTPAARTPAVPTPRSPLEGSILAPATWRQAVAAVQERTIRR
ncbi:flagellar biosynthetic protein FliO [Isoptericola sp. b490]|uniref:flagellar biosynthetic protein FliO n=1 Tax=Actinotalea lenta TaxID=3064654 RepID=UPI0027130FE1|nr:flagellar biosynthetic protein FliO [Isoptericola sp. b490]MDO8122173.1 flagellar biosynthetic protein FliO [Isoptericola sp. b490]